MTLPKDYETGGFNGSTSDFKHLRNLKGSQQNISSYLYAFAGAPSGANSSCRPSCSRGIDTCVSAAWSRDCGRAAAGGVSLLNRLNNYPCISIKHKIKSRDRAVPVIAALGEDDALRWAIAACSWGLTCITRVTPRWPPLLLEVVVNRTIAFRGMCPEAVDTRRMPPPWCSSNAISGSVLIVAARVVVVVRGLDVGLPLPLLRCDSGEEGGVSVGNRSEVVARATNLSSMAFGWWW